MRAMAVARMIVVMPGVSVRVWLVIHVSIVAQGAAQAGGSVGEPA